MKSILFISAILAQVFSAAPRALITECVKDLERCEISAFNEQLVVGGVDDNGEYYSNGPQVLFMEDTHNHKEIVCAFGASLLNCVDGAGWLINRCWGPEEVVRRKRELIDFYHKEFENTPVHWKFNLKKCDAILPLYS